MHAQIEAAMQEHQGSVLCVLTTTSCFAPRAADDVEAVARLCKQHHVAHVINNAYGVQVCCLLVESIHHLLSLYSTC